MNLLKRDKPQTSERETKDFFEEHERLKQVKENPQALQQPPQPQLQQAQPAASQHRATSAAPQQSAQPAPPNARPAAPAPQVAQIVSLEVLIAALRELGMDIKPFEALREYARQLDEKERDVSRKIEELQRLLDAIRHARSVLKQLGV